MTAGEKGISDEALNREKLEWYESEARVIAEQFLEQAGLKAGDLVVIGCSSSEITAHKIGSFSNAQLGEAVLDGFWKIFSSRDIYLAAQCCEHLNRALILEAEAAKLYGLEPVNVVPQPKAGGSFATAAYERMKYPAAVEHIRAVGGIDIGDTLIGMHLKEVAVPVRILKNMLGAAHVVCARTRPKFIGGERAHYDELLK
ncbi:MAG: TIGR01440 family protein [Lachnospiraceae bacterium]|nr:TIGR01440 family protein [Lachnospiraceae bacterium]